MPQNITQYRVFIGSPGGLKSERDAFRKALDKCSLYHGDEKGIRFHPVGWEDTIGGTGRPQAHINEDLRQCDYAVFVLHDRWGSPTGNGATSGTKEEWDLAVKLYRENKIRNIALFFKKVDDAKLTDPGDQLKPVLAFKKEIEESKQYLFHSYQEIHDYTDKLDGFLAKWLGDHEKLKTTDLSTVFPAEAITPSPIATSQTVAPDYGYWFGEAERLLSDKDSDKRVALYFSQKAVECASDDLEWAKAQNAHGRSSFHSNKLSEAADSFSEVLSRIPEDADPILQIEYVKALFNKGLTLGALQRGIEAIATYDDLISRFGDAPELPLREQVAKAMFNKAKRLGELERGIEEIAVYSDLITRFSDASELPLREQVAKAMFNKGVTLDALERGIEAIAVYNDLITRVGDMEELPLRESVARAMVRKAVTLSKLNRGMEAIAVYDDLMTRFGNAAELPLRERTADAMLNKGVTLHELERGIEAIAVYDDLIARVGDAPELPLQENVARAIFNKAVTLGALERGVEAIAVYDDLITRFGSAPEDSLKEVVTSANKLRAVANRK